MFDFVEFVDNNTFSGRCSLTVVTKRFAFAVVKINSSLSRIKIN